jgi:hypothetical protein
MKTPKFVAVCFALIMIFSILPHSAAAATATGAVRSAAALPLLSRPGCQKVRPMDGPNAPHDWTHSLLAQTAIVVPGT